MRQKYVEGKYEAVIICDGPCDMEKGNEFAHGHVVLTDNEYKFQLNKAFDFWKCPICFYVAKWDNNNYNCWLNQKENKS
jgi:hypothetical protein